VEREEWRAKSFLLTLCLGIFPYLSRSPIAWECLQMGSTNLSPLFDLLPMLASRQSSCFIFSIDSTPLGCGIPR